MCSYHIVLVLLLVRITSVHMIAPAIFVNHGGGPNPVLGEKQNLEIADSLKHVKNVVDLKSLKAIIVVTAHWEADDVMISSGKHHGLLYDYNNFPPESYKFQYNASGTPELALRLHSALNSVGIEAKLDDTRGWDHGVFIPMMLINPAADIPVLQVSIMTNQNANLHYKLGEILKQFRKEGIAIVGSGMSYHNMGEFMKYLSQTDEIIVNEEFDSFLNEACTSEDGRRKDMLSVWDKQTGGLEAHPLGEADHLMPLVVAAGAGGSQPGEQVFSGVFLGKFKLSGYIWRD